jgi:flavin reductase (DIM6/NTAB) family NADH-FMN oxidoreductase RutF
MECRLFEIVDIGKQIGQASLVIGSVVYFHIDDSVYMPDYKIDTMKLKPLARLAGSTYAKITETFDLERPGDAKTFVAG